MIASHDAQKKLNVTLTDREVLILKSFALGLNRVKICELLAINTMTFETNCYSLYSKLEVGNPFSAVQTAFQKKILQRKFYCPEKIKALALEFATEKTTNTKSLEGSKNELWNCYDLLIDFYSYMEANILPNKKFQRE